MFRNLVGAFVAFLCGVGAIQAQETVQIPRPAKTPPTTQGPQTQKAIDQLDGILKKLHGPANQLDLKQLSNELADAIRQLKEAQRMPGTSDFEKALRNLQIQSGWGGPGSAPWMPGMPRGVRRPDDFDRQLPEN